MGGGVMDLLLGLEGKGNEWDIVDYSLFCCGQPFRPVGSTTKVVT